MIEAIQKIGEESSQEQPDVSAGNPFGLEATGGEVASGLGFCETSSPSKVQVTNSKPNKRFRFNPDTSQHQRKLGKPFAQTTQATQGKVVDT